MEGPSIDSKFEMGEHTGSIVTAKAYILTL
jgi:hypothetical protein